MNASELIRITVDPANHGQFLACCGLLELADRLWPATEGWFEKGKFCLRQKGAFEIGSASRLLDHLASCVLTNTMTP